MLRIRSAGLAAVMACSIGCALEAQTNAQTPAPVSVSGLLFGSYNIQRPPASAPLSRQLDNSFILDRVYLTFRAPAGERVSIRVTTDIYPTTEGTSNAYTLRAKYAYLQYDGTKQKSGAQLTGRLGILHNVVIEHIETFWPRYLSQLPIERAGFFSSADMGIAALMTLPDRMGEVYATITNGPGYTSREVDRFKDFAIRASLTPLANNKQLSLLNTFTLTAWAYKGATASACLPGAAPCSGGFIGEALDRSRAGLFVGIKDPKLVLGAEYARRHEDGEVTPTGTRAVTGMTGTLTSALTVVRPFAFVNATGKSPFALVARYDRVKPTSSTTGFSAPPSSANAYHTLIAGLQYDLNAKVQLSLDYQESLPSSNGASLPLASAVKGYYAHFLVNF